MITDIVIAAAAVLFLGVYVSWRAGRLDRMHTRLEAAQAALDVTLVRRSSVALELASSAFLDPATSVLLASAAHEARGGLRPGRPVAQKQAGKPAQAELAPGDELDRSELTQSNLSRALRATFTQPGFRASLDGKDGAGELIAEAVHALEMGANAEDLALTVHPHPTLSETVGFSAELAEGTITDLLSPAVARARR